jgi:uncharacterized protein (TIGR02284 family)
METITSKQTVEILNDLVRINNDRIEGYEKALKELRPQDEDLKPLFLNNIDQSRKIKQTLGNELQTLGGDIDSSTTSSGSIYRVWTDVKAVFAGHDRHSVLSNCEYGEDAAQNAYESALKSEQLPAYLVQIVLEEREKLKAVHNEIKTLRDQSAKES